MEKSVSRSSGGEWIKWLTTILLYFKYLHTKQTIVDDDNDDVVSVLVLVVLLWWININSKTQQYLLYAVAINGSNGVYNDGIFNNFDGVVHTTICLDNDD